MVFGATTFREFVRMLSGAGEEDEVRDPCGTRMVFRGAPGRGLPGPGQAEDDAFMEPVQLRVDMGGECSRRAAQ